jgi:ketosteroid isomerase-like protein
MRSAWLLALVLLTGFFWPAAAQESKNKGVTPELEKTLSDVNQQWLCAGPYQKPKAKDCVAFRAQYWADQFFEIYPNGQVQTKAEMVASQSKNAAEHPDAAPGTGPNPQEFQLRAVYGNVALATDHTIFKALDAKGQLTVTGEARVLRIFEKENGKWRPASAALVGIEKPK